MNSGNPANPDDNQTVTYAYTDGLMTSLTADLPSGETDQTTTYIYGTTKGTPTASKIATGHLLRAAKYPDSTNTGTTSANIDTDSSDVMSYAYNAQGELTYQKDQAGNVTELDLDDLGRETQRRVTTLATGFDGAVRRIARTYLSLGQPELVTQYDNATVGSGSVVDEVKYTFDGWSGVTKFEQDRNSAVGASGSVDDYEVSYSYEKATTGRNAVRRTGATLPSGNVITYSYTLNQNNAASLVGKVLDGAVILSKYDYLGASWVVGENYHEPGLDSRRYGTGTANYTDLDRFNRIITSRWTTDASSRKDFYKVDVTYDRNSNITVADDGVHAGFDVQYTMDDLDRLTRAQEGTWSAGSITSEKRDQEWTTLTHTGNWTREQLDLNGDGDWGDASEHDDTRTHNAVNELTARDLDSTPGTTGNNYTLIYNADGNLTDDGETYTYEWDAFWRMRYIKNRSTSAVVAEYKYNGLSFPISEHLDTDSDGDVDGGDKWFHRAFDERWRMLANFRESDSAPKEEWVNHQAGWDGNGGQSSINAVILRDKDANTTWTAASDGTLEERFYLCQNWRGDAVALVNSAHKLSEWDKYLAYGTPCGLPGADTDSDGDCDATDITQIQTWINGATYDVRGDVDLDADVDSTDKTIAQNVLQGCSLGWGKLSWIGGTRSFTGHSVMSANMLAARERNCSTSLGRWATRDAQLVLADGVSLFEYVRSNPAALVDPFGREGETPAECEDKAACDFCPQETSPPEYTTLQGGGQRKPAELIPPPPIPRDVVPPKEKPPPVTPPPLPPTKPLCSVDLFVNPLWTGSQQGACKTDPNTGACGKQCRPCTFAIQIIIYGTCADTRYSIQDSGATNYKTEIGTGGFFYDLKQDCDVLRFMSVIGSTGYGNDQVSKTATFLTWCHKCRDIIIDPN